MEQIDGGIGNAGTLSNIGQSWDISSHLPIMFSALKSDSYQTFSHNETSFKPSDSWLGCSSRDGWGPLSPKYKDLTPCFLQGILFGTSALLMILVGGSQIHHLRNRKITSNNRISWSFYAKLVLVALQVVFQVVLFGLFEDSGLIKTSLGLNVLATATAFGIHYIEQFKSTIPNGVLLFYWLFQIILNVLRFFNLSLRGASDTQFFTFNIISTVNAALILATELYFPIVPISYYNSIGKISPYSRANVFSRISFDWMGPLMKKGYVQFLTERDLPPLPEELQTATTVSEFETYWRGQKSSNPSLSWAIARAFGAQFALGGFFKFCQDTLALIQPTLLKLLINFVNDYSRSREEGEPIPLTKGLMISAAMFVVSFTQTLFLHQYFQRAFDLGMKIKSSLTAVIYNKSLVLSNETKSESNTGDIVNLMSVDTQRLQDLTQNLHIIWSGPLRIVLCLYLLHGLLGNSMWAGVAIMVVMIPLSGALASYQKKLQRTQMKNKDERSRLISEIMNNIKSLKLYGWEHAYLDKLNYVRNEKELKNLKRMGIFRAISTSTWTLAPFLVSCSTFGLFVLTQKDKTLTTDMVFPALSLFNLLQFPLAVLPNVITSLVEAQVAISRLSKFLTSAELQTDAVIKAPRAEKLGDIAVSINNGTFLWSKAKGEQNYKVALSSINFDAKKGQLDCIVGKVGSGKSSIIQAILGDLYKLDGSVRIHGKVAYVSQVPWIVNGTVRDNILFGHKYDPEFYQQVIKACALTVDLKILTKGDSTLVGEKGISLSGGQKARLSLARAVYARADVYLLDDPLSAVDEHVGKHLTDHVLGPNGLLKTKCKILATNNIKVLSIANNLHMVSDGRLIEQGSYDDIMKQENSKLRQLINEFGHKGNSTPVESDVSTKSDVSDLESATLETDVAETGSLRRASDASFTHEDLYEAEEDEETKARREHSEQGKVKWDVYLSYAKACNPVSVIIYLSCIIISISISVSSNVWLKHWSEVNTEKGYNPHVFKYLGIYFLLGFGYSLANMTQNAFMWIFCTIHGSRRLHNAMAVRVLRANMSFFETTPIGRILNRFSTDVYKIDEILGSVFGMFFDQSAKVMFTLVVIAFSTWQFIFIVAPLGIFYFLYQQYYLRTSRELRRLDSVSKSPIFANFQESLNGVSIIRAYGQEDRFKFLNQGRIDKNLSAYHPTVNANRWLAIRLETLGSLVILAASGLAVITLKSGHLSAGLVGLSVSYSLNITQSLNWIVRMSVEVETNIVSVERVLEYSRLDSEAPEIIEDHRPAKEWPANGEIEFKNYSTKYRPELDLVLKNINLDIKPREKVGIVGRTGAGKSSITLALFRIIEKYGGDIQIDGLDTSSIGLLDLRQRLSIIPQDSQVFEGTIRSNLDPTEIFSDEEIWRALELSHLKDHVQKLYDQRSDDSEIKSPLDSPVSEGGSNLSTGQRQLMCLGRVLLKLQHSNILVLDEATAAVDVETDKILQETIRSEFKDKTIITIAHRLNTILDSDRIIVLEQGEVAEFDSPSNLLKNKDSLFYALCEQGGFIVDGELKA